IYSHMVTLWGNYEGISQRKVFASNLSDKFAVYSREKMIFSSQAATNDDIATLIQNEISGNTQ
ncbi:hypothetical protein FSH04_022405, partial [Escherichia coli]|nr:hypothetical protein [Escherichia coli]